MWWRTPGRLRYTECSNTMAYSGALSLHHWTDIIRHVGSVDQFLREEFVRILHNLTSRKGMVLSKIAAGKTYIVCLKNHDPDHQDNLSHTASDCQSGL